MNTTLVSKPYPKRQKIMAWSRAFFRRTVLWISLLALPMPAALAQTTVNMAQAPLLTLKSAPGLIMMTMSRDHRLFYQAYDNASDLDGDGVLDIAFKPAFEYYGNFVSSRCYKYDASKNKFTPGALTGVNYTCAGASSAYPWSGNWLNWVTATRIDIIKRVLYGGTRSTETPAGGQDYIQIHASWVPNDTHASGKEYSLSDNYDISDYTEITAKPTAPDRRHLFAFLGNPSTPSPSTEVPFLKYVRNTTSRI